MPAFTDAASKVNTSGNREERLYVAAILLVALIHAVTYVIIMPPWQHYEEPSHFEYTRMTADQGTPPAYEECDLTLRREIATSMIAHNFFTDLGFLPTLQTDECESIWIGVNVKGSVPGYPLLVSLPLRLVPHLDVTSQLYVARLLSVVLYLSTVLLAYAITAEFVSPGHPLRFSVPASVALLPGFTDLMSAVNNDVGATFAFSLFILAAVHLIMRGMSFGRLLFLVGATALSISMKNTVLVALPLSALALIFALIRHRSPKIAVTVMFVGGLICLPVLFTWGDAAFWYQDRPQTITSRILSKHSPVGQHAIQLDAGGGARLRQPLPSDAVETIAGHSVTMGAWIWATSPIQARTPLLITDQQTTVESISITTEPAFYALHTSIPERTKNVQVVLHVPTDDGVTVYYDGIVLARGQRPLEIPPTFDSPDNSHGMWGGQPFYNGVRNASGEQAWPRVRPAVEELFKRVAEAHLSPTAFLAALLDWETTGWIYKATTRRVLQTFWGRFGWGHVPLPATLYTVLYAISVVGLIGGSWALMRNLRKMSNIVQFALLWIVLAALALWIPTLLRGLFTVGRSAGTDIYIPTARYAFPAIVPTMLLLVAGWRQTLLPAVRRNNKVFFQPETVIFAGFIIVDIISVVVVLGFYKS